MREPIKISLEGKPKLGGMQVKIFYWNKYGRKKVRELGPFPVAAFTITGDNKLVIYPPGWTAETERTATGTVEKAE